MKWKRPKVLEKTPGVIPEVANFLLLSEEPKFREPHGGNLLYPRNGSLSFEKSLTDRHPICGKMDTQKLLNVPRYPGALSTAAGKAMVKIIAQKRGKGDGEDHSGKGDGEDHSPQIIAGPGTGAASEAPPLSEIGLLPFERWMNGGYCCATLGKIFG